VSLPPDPAYSSARGNDALDFVTAVADDLDAKKEQRAPRSLPPLEPGQARILDVTDREYHADPCATPSLNQSTARRLITQSPAHAYLYHPRLGGQADEQTASKDNGSLYHAILLGGESMIELIAADDFRTKAAREARDAAKAGGKVPLLVKDHADVMKAVEAIRARFVLLGVSLEGDHETAIDWCEDSAFGPVMCRGKLDVLALPTITDIKSCRTAAPRSCENHIVEYGYDIQRAAYVSAVEKLRPELVGRVGFDLIFFETEAPYAVTPGPMSGELRELGARKWRRAIDLWGKCLRSNDWPGYVTGPVTFQAPAWAMAQELTEGT
jgi:hypothetical protein